MQKVLMIVGMHRSGTSLVTQWLSRCGLPVGTHLLAGSTGNTEGHFEDEDFLALHRKWFTTRQLIHDGLQYQSLTPLSEAEAQDLKTLLAQKAAENEQWGWKDPRTCLWLPAYRQHLPAAFNLVVVRNFNDTINSLVMREYRIKDKIRLQKVQRKKGLSKLKWKYLKRKGPEFYFRHRAEEYLRIWVHYYEQILAYCNSLPPQQYCIVSYEALLQDDEAVLQQLIQQWGFSLQPVPFKDIFKKELLSNTRPVARYVKDKALVNTALQLEARCLALTQRADETDKQVAGL